MWNGKHTDRTSYWTRQPPPPLPSYFPSLACPKDTYEHLLIDSIDAPPPVDQLAEIQRNVQRSEFKAVYSLKDPDWENFRLRNHQHPLYCAACSEYGGKGFDRMRVIGHYHQSTLQDRIVARLDPQGRYRCTDCEPHPARSNHYVDYADRYPVLLTSSTMLNWIGDVDSNGFEGAEHHVDIIAISGGTVHPLKQAFRADFGRSLKPVDLCVCFGINDLGKGRPVDGLWRDLMKLKAEVLEIHPRHPTGPSTFSMCTVPLPPIYTRFSGDVHTPRRDLTDRFWDYTERIVEHNYRAPQHPFRVNRAPQFHKYGVTSRRAMMGEARVLRSIPWYHNHLDWRERDPDRQLHINDVKRLAMGRAVVSFFANMYRVNESSIKPTS